MTKDFHGITMKTTSAEHGQNMGRTWAEHVVILWVIEAKIKASDKDLPVLTKYVKS